MRTRIRPRLPLDRYGDDGSVWFVTVVTRDRRPLLSDETTARLVVDTINFVLRDSPENLLLYVVMPDHVRFLITIDQTGLVSLVQRFKSWTSRQWNAATGAGPLWQESFHDKGVRRTENIDELIAYALDNPVRKGLVADWTEWPWLGGSLIGE